MNFIITSEQIIGFCGFIASLWAAVKVIKELKKPNNDLRKKVESHDGLLKNDNERLKEVEASNKMILQCLLVIINHDITGNGIDKMKQAREELQNFLIER